MWRLILSLLVLVPAASLPAAANHVPVDTLLQRMFTDPAPKPYEVSADFGGTVVIKWRGGQVTAQARGSFREWRAAQGQPKRREVTVTSMDLPFILRPFSGALKDLIEERVEHEEGTLALLNDYDVFIAEESPNGRFVLAGVRSDIVSQTIRRYGRTSDLRDVNVRRAVAAWLYHPRQRAMVTRPGAPFLVTAVVDEEGTYYSLIFTYDWGPVGTQIDWANFSGRLIWREVKMDASSDLRGFGHVEGKFNLRFSNYCFNSNCRR